MRKNILCSAADADRLTEKWKYRGENQLHQNCNL